MVTVLVRKRLAVSDDDDDDGDDDIDLVRYIDSILLSPLS